jgi:hypothetical protein
MGIGPIEELVDHIAVARGAIDQGMQQDLATNCLFLVRTSQCNDVPMTIA